ncbi:MAG: hypothetical protein LBM66_00895 [Bifidobacteriaceae bacterium]|jgi:DNA polymerase-3 subunit delta|nr:hypothetical protein [Bifidobacteriaceae bacterium]
MAAAKSKAGTAKKTGRGRAAAHTVPWNRAEPDRVVLVSGPEDFFAERGIGRLTRLARDRFPEAETVRLDAAGYDPGALLMAASPSLFADAAIVVVQGVAEASDPFLTDALAYVAAPNPDAVVILRHRGGQRGKKLLDQVRAAGYPEVDCQPLTRDRDKTDFVVQEFRRQERTAAPDAIHAIVEAVGQDTRELAAAVAQLTQDTVGQVDRAAVDRYYGGRIEASGFNVADAAVAGNVPRALGLVRHALMVGVDPVPIVGALAAKLRQLAKAGGAARAGLGPGQLGMAPWQADRARKELRHWRPEQLAHAILVVAKADQDVKSLGRAGARFAAEQAVIDVARAARAI